MVPHVSSMQHAARVKETWEEACLSNLATRTRQHIIDRIRMAETVGLFPSSRPPVARGLLDLPGWIISALCLREPGCADERVTQGGMASVNGVFAAWRHDPAVQARRADQQRISRFTSALQPIRTICPEPTRLALSPSGGSGHGPGPDGPHPSGIVCRRFGSGSVAIEAAQLAQLDLVCIEQDTADYHLVLANARTFGVTNLKAVWRRATVFNGCSRTPFSSAGPAMKSSVVSGPLTKPASG